MAAQAEAAESGTSLTFRASSPTCWPGTTDYTNQLFEPILNFFQDPIGNSIQLITDFLTNRRRPCTWGPFLFAVVWQVVSWVGASLTYPQLLLWPLLGYDARHRARCGQRDLRQTGGSTSSRRRRGRRAGPGHHPRRRRPRCPSRGSRPRRSVPVSPGRPPPARPLPARRRRPPHLLNSCRTRCAATIQAKASRRPCAIPPPQRRPRPTSPLLLRLPLPRRPVRRGKSQKACEVRERGYRDEYMDVDSDADSEPPPPEEARVSASTRGAGPMGFSGTAPKSDAPAAGLTRLPGDSFGGGPVGPMLPTTWDANEEQPDDGEERNKP